MIKKLIKAITNKSYRISLLMNRGFYDRLSDEEFVRVQYKAAFGREPDLEAPKTFNEKIQWLKLHYRDPRYTELVDKLAVKRVIAETLGERYVIPTIGSWETPEEVPFDSLPEKYVLKCTHNSGSGTVICRNNSQLDRKAALAELHRGMNEDFYKKVREYPYKNVPRRIICEQFLENTGSRDMPDYKFHCFNGEPKFILVCRNRFGKGGMTEDFFTTEWERIPVARPDHPNSAEPVEKTELLDEMLRISRTLSAGIPFVRVDLYAANGQIYFGELTFFPASGAKPFLPETYDRIFGDMLELPARNTETGEEK